MPLKDKIYITEFDMKRLKGLINFAEERWDKRFSQYLRELDPRARPGRNSEAGGDPARCDYDEFDVSRARRG